MSCNNDKNSVTSGKEVGDLFTHQSTKKARKGAVLDAAIGSGGDAKDCGGSATDITSRFGYVLGLASLLK
eukprot:14851129-Ditylum_brightwellii.AAC.1